MGADGGSIPDRRDLVKTKAKAEQTDKALLRELFFLCALSKKPLAKPVVADPLGKLYNKDAIIEYFLDKTKYGDGDKICGYLKGVKDLLTLNLCPNPTYERPTASSTNSVPARAPFVCHLSLKEMSGSIPFIALRPCGCVFSETALRSVIPTLTKGLAPSNPVKEKENGKAPSPESDKTAEEGDKEDKSVSCPNCGTSFDPTLITSILPINPPRSSQELLLDHLLATRAASKSSKKRKTAPTTTDTTKATIVGDTKAHISTDSSTAKIPRNGSSVSPTTRSSASPAPSSAVSSSAPTSLARSVHDKLMEQEKKRLAAQAGMSDAVKSMFKPKDVSGQRKNGAEEFFGRTFTRYAA